MSEEKLPGDKFKYLPADETRQLFFDTLRHSNEKIFIFLNDTLADSREKSLALTKLEEFAMWANKACSHGGLKNV